VRGAGYSKVCLHITTIHCGWQERIEGDWVELLNCLRCKTTLAGIIRKRKPQNRKGEVK